MHVVEWFEEKEKITKKKKKVQERRTRSTKKVCN